MKTPAGIVEIFLKPGEYYFGDSDTRIRTLLGSCVAITLWHPERRIGGMCHYMLPGRPRDAKLPFDGKYADEALQLLIAEIIRAGTELQEYEVKMFGGGNMFPNPERCRNDHVGRKNAQAGRRLMAQHGISSKGGDLEGTGHRNIVFDMWSGEVWVKRVSLGDEPEQCIKCAIGKTCYGR